MIYDRVKFRKRVAEITRHRRSFTLIELLVVITIIAILAAMLLPALRSVREKGRKVVCVSNMRQIFMGFMYYLQDHDGFYPPDWEYPPVEEGGAGEGTVESPDWCWLIGNELGFNLDPYYGGDGPHNWPNKVNREAFLCPTRLAIIKDRSLCGYGYNAHKSDGYGYKQTGTREARLRLMKVGRLEYPSETVLLMDAMAYSRYYWNNNFYEVNVGVYDHFYAGYHSAPSSPAYEIQSTPDAGPNVLYCDGHVSWIQNREIKNQRFMPYGAPN